MEAARAPSPFRGLAVALILGVVLAVAAVGVLAHVPSNVELTGAYQSPTTNTTTFDKGSQPNSSVPPASSLITGMASLVGANSSVPNAVSVDQFVSSLAGGQAANTSNNSLNPAPTGNASNASPGYFQDRSATVAAEVLDLVIFGAAGALSLTAFLLSRRRMS